jgi:hypothetical protein
MERVTLRITPENFITVGVLAAAAYLGVIGIQALLTKFPVTGKKAAKSE